MRAWSVIAGLCLLAGAAASAGAAECPGNPDALGTSRVITVDPAEHTRIGTMQYRETLPLEDHEVVLTFDDGPLPPYSNRILDILASACIKATFFMVGRQARAYPDMVRKVYNEGHTVASHSQNHPLIFTRLSMAGAENEIEQGRASVAAALGDERALAPFFRFPGLGRSNAIEDYLVSRGMMTWSADFPADDWRHITAQQVFARALDRLERKGKGVLLLHDIQPRTVIALPAILKELKARGYRIVHVVPAGPDRPKTLAPPEAWAMHRPPAWPRVLERDPAFAGENTDYPDRIALPITLATAEPAVIDMPLVYPTPGRSRLWPETAREFPPVEHAPPSPVSQAGSPVAVAMTDIGLSWSVENVVWPPVAKPAHVARRKPPIHARPAARPWWRALFPPPSPKSPQLASHILTLH
ncbi:MAG TPA: polysaccharide deacetylase family protein [Xanthobacteraceae bacterium]|nr:polysaccharide deacetylase family protein [Xanthobacteraceae bacterium]